MMTASKGCKDVRSVIGFPGMVVPGDTNVLIILAGFEHERAKCLIDEMDADKIYLGLGTPDSITDENHRQPLSIFNGITERALALYSDVFRFDFRACEPSEVLLKVKEIIDATPTANHIVVPMNTKLSTLAVAALGLQDSKVQICYSQPDTYNFTGYSQTGDDITVVDCSDFLLV